MGSLTLRQVSYGKGSVLAPQCGEWSEYHWGGKSHTNVKCCFVGLFVLLITLASYFDQFFVFLISFLRGKNPFLLKIYPLDKFILQLGKLIFCSSPLPSPSDPPNYRNQQHTPRVSPYQEVSQEEHFHLERNGKL